MVFLFLSSGIQAVIVTKSCSMPITFHLVVALPSGKIFLNCTSMLSTSTSAENADRIARPTPLTVTHGVSSMNKLAKKSTGISMSSPALRSSCTVRNHSMSLAHFGPSPGVASNCANDVGHNLSPTRCRSQHTSPVNLELMLAAAASPNIMCLSRTKAASLPSSPSQKIVMCEGIAAAIRLNWRYHDDQSHLSHSSGTPSCLR